MNSEKLNQEERAKELAFELVSQYKRQHPETNGIDLSGLCHIIARQLAWFANDELELFLKAEITQS